jgi:hypothetical protein
MAGTGEDSRPVWLLDVDGVINATAMAPAVGVWPRWLRGRARASGTSWPITWAPPVVDAIRRVHDADAADIRWLTTWLDDANESLGPMLGLPELPVVPRPHGHEEGAYGFVGVRAGAAGRWWKLEAARRLMDPQPWRPLVWTDDDLGGEPDAVAWAEARPGPTLLVAPPTEIGLTVELLAAVEHFCTDTPGRPVGLVEAG